MELSDIKGTVDFAILTIREDEFEAVLDRFPPVAKVKGRRVYNLHRLELPQGGSYLVAVVRCIEQGNAEALDAARDLLEELAPHWLIVVGIAGAVPSDEFGLGDVVVSTRIHDFSVEAVLQDKEPEHAIMGGPVHKDAAIVVADLRALKSELAGWNTPASVFAPRPPIDLDDKNFYGDAAWQGKARSALSRHATRTQPLVTAGAIGSSDKLVKDTKVLATFLLKAARQVLAVEMESAGVYRAATGRHVPCIAVRGISDVVGFKRDPGWTTYACHSAASFTYAFLRSRPIDPRGSHQATTTMSARRSESADFDPTGQAKPQHRTSDREALLVTPQPSTSMRDSIFNALLGLTPEQFETVTYRSAAPKAIAFSKNMSQQERASELVSYFEHHISNLDPLVRLIRAVTMGHNASPDPGCAPAPVPAENDVKNGTRELVVESFAVALARETDQLADLIARGASSDDVRVARSTVREMRRQSHVGREPQRTDVLSRRYQLLDRIGEGGFATVWKALDRRTTQVVALKILHGHHAHDLTRRERFFRGARVMQILKHEHIIGVMEAQCEDRGMCYFVMEHIARGDLHRGVIHERLSWDSLCATLLQAGAALSFGHKRGIIHRDVKPQNILIDSNARAHITDFDLAHVPDSTLLTRTAPLGTFVYASPEEISSPTLVDARSDIFSWGMTIAFGLFGVDLPWDAFRATDKFVDRLDCSKAVRRVLKKCTAWTLEQRFSSMDEACDALRVAYFGRTTRLSSREKQTSSQACSTSIREHMHEKDGSLMVYVPSGEYVIGADDLDLQSRPVHRVYLSAFWICKCPITNAQYRKFIAETNHRPPLYHEDSRFNQPDQPVVGVSWEDAREYCTWAGLRLPSEAQWEAAARGSCASKYPWGEQSPNASLANYGRCYGQTTAVTRFAEAIGPMGTLDQSGNVWEWCEDVWDPDAYRKRLSAVRNPVATVGDETRRVLRGGCWVFDDVCLRSAHRDWFRMRNRGDDVGFRCILLDVGLQ